MSETPTPAEPEDGGAGSKEQVLKELAEERRKRQAAEKLVADSEAALAKANKDHQATVDGLNARVTELETSVTAEAAKAERLQVLRDKNVPQTLDEFITGATVEEITANADKALSVFQATTTSEEVTPIGMRPDARQGGDDVALNGDALEQGLREALGI